MKQGAKNSVQEAWSGEPGPVISKFEVRSSKFEIWCDRAVIGGIVSLIVFTPLAFGFVHPRAYSIMEALVFLLVVVGMINVTVLAGSRDLESMEQGAWSGGNFEIRNSKFEIHSAALPLALFLVFVLFQLLPLPPFSLRVLSPQTFEYYTQSLPGWPERVPYADIGNQMSEVRGQRSETSYSLPDPSSLLPAPCSMPFALCSLLPAPRSLLPDTWLPLSLAPTLTRTDLLKFTAYGALFFLVLLYPFGPVISKFEFRNSKLSDSPSAIRHQPSAVSNSRADERFFRAVLIAVLFSGLLVAAIGFIQRFSWNGRILWFFAPYDWAQSVHEEVARASGPFVNADHFANYLALIFPVALAYALFRKSIVSKRLQVAVLIFCTLSASLLFTGILLSLSRIGWISALSGLTILLWLSPWRLERGIPSLLVMRGVSFARISLSIVSALLIVSLFSAGPGGREQLDRRLAETVNQESGIWGRVSIWKDSVGMIRDFPLFGVGLGAWPELFMRYRRPPWTPDFYREAHNDYLELLAETGVTGFGLLAWFFFRGVKALVKGFRTASPKRLPLMAAILAALGVMAFHEWFDFSLQIPANAFLFTVFLALGLRMAGSAEQGAGSWEQGARSAAESASSYQPPALGCRSAVLPLAIGSLALLLVFYALTQEPIPYPYNFREPESLAGTKEFFLSRPTQASSHLALLRLMGNRVSLSGQLTEAKAALWIEPTNPYIRDFYATSLLSLGKKDEGLREVKRSIANSPALETHFYLSEKFVPRLSKAEQAVIEDGFKEALALEYRGALDALAGYYGTLSRFSDQGALYEQAALGENDGAQRSGLLRAAGVAYLKARDRARAEVVLRRAAADFPSDPQAYQQLATAIYGVKEDFQKAEEIVLEGIRNGAPPVSLYLSLAEAAQKVGIPSQSKRALIMAKIAIEKAAKEGEDADPLYLALADGAHKVGDHIQEMAALIKSLDLRPNSCPVLCRLGNLYLEQRNFDRAAHYFRKATVINPVSADTHYHLAVAEEARYQFAAADDAYARAVELASENSDYRRRYDAFRARLEQNNKVPAGEGKAGSREQGFKKRNKIVRGEAAEAR
jgi:O-antigen ligase/Flp pilus assembly protein TadD